MNHTIVSSLPVMQHLTIIGQYCWESWTRVSEAVSHPDVGPNSNKKVLFGFGSSKSVLNNWIYTYWTTGCTRALNCSVSLVWWHNPAWELTTVKSCLLNSRTSHLVQVKRNRSSWPFVHKWKHYAWKVFTLWLQNFNYFFLTLHSPPNYE